jgi:hypothetical protein
LLHLEGQAIHAATHVGMAGRIFPQLPLPLPTVYPLATLFRFLLAASGRKARQRHGVNDRDFAAKPVDDARRLNP